MISRKQLYAFGETFGDSATRVKPGGRIYGSGGGAADAGGVMANGNTGLPTSVRTNSAAQQFNPLTAFRMGQPAGGMPSLSIAPVQPTGLLGSQPMAAPISTPAPVAAQPTPAMMNQQIAAQEQAQPNTFWADYYAKADDYLKYR